MMGDKVVERKWVEVERKMLVRKGRDKGWWEVKMSGKKWIMKEVGGFWSENGVKEEDEVEDVM